MRNLATRRGFTLVEMAMVIVIIGLVMLTVFPALVAVRAANEVSLTQTNLHSLMMATAAYVQANGCLPCPATPRGATTSFGMVGTGGNSSCGVCSSPEGIVPFASLGVPLTTAKDGWGYWITMRVDPALTNIVNSANCAATNTCTLFTPPTAPCSSADITNGYCVGTQIVGTYGKGFCKANLSSSNSFIKVAAYTGATQPAGVIFISHGKKGYGSYYAQPFPDPADPPRLSFPSDYLACAACNPNCGITGGAAMCNAAGTAQFVDASSIAGTYYDDVLLYADRDTLVSTLGNPACQSKW